jgi:hypothetical protein
MCSAHRSTAPLELLQSSVRRLPCAAWKKLLILLGGGMSCLVAGGCDVFVRSLFSDDLQLLHVRMTSPCMCFRSCTISLHDSHGHEPLAQGCARPKVLG